jgi:NTE family protein
MGNKRIDLVLSGGGIKGIGLVGAVAKLLDAGYRPYRISGTSAGAVFGAVVAAASIGNQLTGDQLRDLALTVDYRKFLDPGPVERVPLLGPAWAIVQGTGMYRGDAAHAWMTDELQRLGVNTFADLRIDDADIPEERRYRLVVTVADVTTGQLVRLPWDYRRVYGLDPDEQLVADAVRASMAIPFFYHPVSLTSSTGLTSTLVDGGLLSNYPIDSFDRLDGNPPRWATLGVTLLPNLPNGTDQIFPVLAPLRVAGGPRLLENVISTVLVGHDQTYLNQPWVRERTIQVDTTKVGVFDFGISAKQKRAVYDKGYSAAEKFLATWNERAYISEFR